MLNSMVSYKTFLLFLMMVLIGTACKDPIPKKKQESNSETLLSNNLDAYFLALTKLQKFNGAVLIQKDKEIIFYKAYNMENVNGSMHVAKNSQFDIHSISKLMAKACIVKLEKDGLINRNNTVSDYLTDFPRGEEITIQNLLDNQSGLPRGLSQKPMDLIDKTPSEFVELIKKEELLFAPGSETLYSNLGYQLVYYIISEITQKPFVQYLKDEFFIPLGMDDSGAHFYLDKANLTRAVKNHEEDNGEVVVVPNYTNTSKNQSRAYSTVQDLLKFIVAMKKEPYYSFLKNSSGNIGWSGGGDGILSHAEASVSSGYELIFFSNYDEISFGKILGDIEKIMTNQPFEIPKEINRKAVQISGDILESYVGKYDMAEFNHDEFEIKVENNSIAFYQNAEYSGILKAENDSTFFGDPKDEDYFIFRKIKNRDYDLIYKYKGVDIVGKRK